jgi:hypothetical protein
MTFPTLDPLMFPDDVAGADNVARSNCLLNAFRVAVNNSLAVMAMVDGVVDEFEDETGVTTSTGATYDASGDYYHNPGGDALVAQGAGTPIGNMTSEGHSLSEAFDGVIIGSHDDNSALQNPGSSGYTAWIGKDWGAGTTRVITKVLANSCSAGQHIVRSPNGVRLEGSATGAWGGEQEIIGTASWGSAHDYWYEVTSVDTSDYRYHRISLSSDSNGVAVQEMRFYEADPSDDMTLVSETSVAEAAPDEAFLCVWQEDVDSVTLNTDLLAYVTRDTDAGTPKWTQVTLTEEATLDTGRILTGSVDISGAASDVDMAWKLVVANNKEQRIHGVGLSWS